jgi:serine/threonine-protein kinase
MRTCPICNARYEAPAQYCQVDGSPLSVETPAHDPYLGKKIVEQFRLVRVVGSGGMGVVYEGEDEGLGRRVAVKILHRDLVTNKDIVQRFHREARIAHGLDHPGIVRVILFGQLPDGNLYLVLEFLEGPTLMEALARDGRFAPARAVKVVAAVADAIGYAHERGIVHRDLKPENIILTCRDGDPDFPKVLDFGIAKTLIGSGSFVTQSGLIFGTARYISPEGAAGEPVDKRGDVYSLAVIAYQLLTGHTPFESDEPMQLLLKHMHDAPPPMRHWAPDLVVPPALEAVVMRALAKNPDARFEDGNLFAKALREALPDGGGDRVAIRSSVPTAAMTSFVATAPPSAAPRSVQGLAQASTVGNPAIPAVAGTASSVPVSVVDSSGVARVRTHTRGDGESASHGARIVPPGVSHVGSGTAQGLALHLPPRMELPAVSPEAIAASVARSEPPATPPPEAPVQASDDDLPSIAPKRSGVGRTFALVLVSMVCTVALVIVGAWGFRMFPSQRREDEIRVLLLRANEALRLGRYTHSSSGEDVEDLTDAVLVLDPRNTRAQEIRRNAATRLKVASDTERTAGRPDRAVDLLREALRLVDDPILREELAAAQREVEAQRNAARTSQSMQPSQPTRGTPRPVPRPPTRNDPTLVHPTQPVQPLHPPVVPVAPVDPSGTGGPPDATSRTVRPRRDGGPTLPAPTPPQDEMSVLPPPEPPRPPRPVFGDTPSLVPLEPLPPAEEPPHTGAF